MIITSEWAPGTALPFVSLPVTDPDAGDTHTYSIDGGIDAGYFAINQSTGAISFAAVFDVLPADSPKTTELIVKATDNGGLTGTATLSITITNVNKSPYFTNIPKTIQVSESVTSGTQLYVISTNDLDGDVVQVSMTTDTIMTSSIITFNSTLNVLSLADGSSLDHETCTVHNLTFVAFDGTDQSGQHTLIVQVTDFNEPPVFPVPIYHVTVPETLAGGAVFPGSSFTVTEVDVGDTYTYSIASGTEAASFAIQASTGNVSFAVDYDVSPFESPKTTALVIKATDSGYLTGTTTLSVTITNVNKSPYFSNLPQTVTIAEDTNPGSTVYITSAVDPDQETILVSMTTDNLLTSSKVLFNASSGILTVLSSFDYETCTVHVVTFTAFDGMIYSEATNLTILITNANESPEVAQTTYYFSASEGKINDALALPVPMYPAIDPDGDFPLSYSLVPNSHSSYFVINATSGVLYYTVDFICSLLSPDLAELVTRISDPNGRYTDTNIKISISHTNTKPQAMNLPANITFPESYATGGFLYAVNLYDPDGESMTCRFLYSPSSAYATFAISQSGSTLNVSLSGTFDTEVTSLYTINIIISDGIEDSDSYELHIIISDVNEPPSFSQSFYDVTTQEDKNGTLISNAITFDDEDVGDILSVSIKDGNSQQRFYLDVSAKLFFYADYDVDDTFFPNVVNLTLEVKDSGLLSATTVVRVTIADVNDNVPEFETAQYVHSTSNSAVGSTVLTVTASDLDSGLNGACVYLLDTSNSNPYKDTFAVSESGSILLMQSINDYASDHVFIFDVIVSDKGTPSLSSTSEVRLIITQDVVIEQAATSAQVTEQEEVDVASLMTRPEILGMIAAVVAGIVLTAIGNIVCWLRMAKATGKETPNPELTKVGKNDVDEIKNPLNSKTKKTRVPNPPLKKPKMPRSLSTDTQVEDYSCWDEISGKSKLSQTSSDPGISTSRIEVLTPFDTPSHPRLSRTTSITQYVSHMTGKKTGGFL
ncbi:protocadherin Fat 4-like [Pecten maximus]|uniref:protocadherin Fat 4-like n=1 Tax=Pecten maximus TaxID=6579 RepID=UPI001458F15A|nr:protocadherin Fat 4-like [Pecten maximus]